MKTKMKKIEKSEIEFEFQEVGLQEAEHLVAAGDGKYSSLVILLGEQLKAIEKQNEGLSESEKKSFAFGLPKGQDMEERNRRALCMAVTKRLNKTGLHWRVAYSGNKKLFVCVPKASYLKNKPQENKSSIKMQREARNSKILEMQKNGLTASAIAKSLGITMAAVTSYLSRSKFSMQGNLKRNPVEARVFSDQAFSLRKQGLSMTEIARKLAATKDLVRYYLNVRSRRIES